MKLFTTPLTLLLTLLFMANFTFALSLDDDDADDIDDAIELAYELANDNKFSQAKNLLQQTKNSVDEADELDEALSVVKNKHNAYIKEQERLTRLERERKERQLAAYNQIHRYGQSSSNSSGSYAFSCVFKCRTDGFVFYDRQTIGPFTAMADSEYNAEYSLESQGKQACKIRKSGNWMWLDSVDCKRSY